MSSDPSRAPTGLSRRQFAAWAAGGLTAATWPQRASAQADPGGRITILVGFPPGGTPDLVARVIAERMRARLGRPVIVENRTGASGQIAMQTARTAPAASTTLVLSPSEMLTLRPHVVKTLPYDPFADFVPVASLCSNPYGFAVGALTSVKSLAEFVAWCKANPRDATYGTPGAGTPHHFLGVMFARAAGIEFTHVPYRGGAIALNEVQSGQIAAIIAALPLLVTQLRPGGALNVLAITGRARSRSLPNVPTFAELGYEGLEAEGVLALVAPASLAAAEARKLTEAVEAIVRTDEFAQAVEKFGQQAYAMPAAEFATRLRRESERWKALVRDTGFKPEE
jgi:tripartite-type tricarboxylate transporter receptor subunit TctC